MKKFLFTLAAVIVTAVAANAQPYKNAVGVVFAPDFSGNSHVVSVQWKHFVNASNNVDVRAGHQFNWGPEVSALFEWNFPVKESGVSFYAGPGVHIGLVTDYNGKKESCLGFGFAGAAGVEYLFRKCPVALSLDWHPYLTWQPSIDNKAGFGWRSFQIGMKYSF